MVNSYFVHVDILDQAAERMTRIAFCRSKMRPWLKAVEVAGLRTNGLTCDPASMHSLRYILGSKPPDRY
jgi:type II secretory pathway component PulL